MPDPAVRLDVRPDAVAVLTLDQPGSKANVLTSQMWTELEAAIDSLATRTVVRGLVIASAKPGIFIAGADLKLLANAPGPNDPAVRSFIEHGLRVLEKLEALPFPTCAAIDGATLGGGLEVALACDYRAFGSSDKVMLGLPEVTLGLIPGWGGTQRLPRLIGMDEAAELLATGRSYPASAAAVAGLADWLPYPGMLIDVACEQVSERPCPDREKRLAAVPVAEFELRPESTADSTATREAIRVMVEGAPLPLYDAIRIETEAFLHLAGSPESKRLIGEFFASRKK